VGGGEVVTHDGLEVLHSLRWGDST
jgi:hypothetical protein